MEKRDVWGPVTPEKAVLTGMQQNQEDQEGAGDENWQDLLGIYTDVLKDESCELPPVWNPNSCIGVNQIQVQPSIGDFGNAMLACSSGSGGLVVENVGDAGSYLQSAATPRKVDSLAELLGLLGNSPHSPAVEKAVDIGGYNLQQMSSSRLSVGYKPSYNPNLLQKSEDGDASSLNRPFLQGPATPDQHKVPKSSQIGQIPPPSTEEISKENNKDNFVQPQQGEIGDREHSNGFVSDTQSAASPDMSTNKEKQNLGGNNGEFYMNETPPQKTPKRRKHRPKVVKEGKPRRTRKAAAKENKNPGGDPPTKRKYVRKKGVKSSTNQSADAENGAAVPKSRPRGRPCKRALNFDSENINSSTNQSVDAENGAAVPNSKPRGRPRKRALNFDLENGVGKKKKCREFDNQEDCDKGRDVEAVHQNVCSEPIQTECAYDFVPVVDKILPQPQESWPPAATVSPTPSKGHTLNAIARSLNARSASQVHQHTGGDFAQLILASTRQQNLGGLRQPRLHGTPLLLEDIEKKEREGAYYYTEPTQPLTVSQIWPRGGSEMAYSNNESIIPWKNVVESNINGLRMASGITSAGKFFEQTVSPMHMNGALPYFGIDKISTLINPTYGTNEGTRHWCINSMDSGLRFQQQMADTRCHPFAEAQTNSSLTAIADVHMPSTFAESQTNSSLTAIADVHMPSTPHRGPKVIKGNETTDAPARVKRQYIRKTPANKLSTTDRVVKIKGSQEYKRNVSSVDDITDGMKNLNISKDVNALVPYTRDGVVVPYEAFEPIKKRLPRPKVDLDPETNRLWNLLMGIEGSENAETLDEEKQKKWEEDRRVFRGRVDSFIARMHLVQGDRRFSRWKGSVVDSVIGVYLTQNVTDHLSSSAFMSLAAKFQIKSTNTRDTSCQKEGNPSTTEYVVHVSHPDGTTCHQRMTTEEVPSVTVKKQTGRTEESILSSQSSSGSMSFQASEDIRSSSGSNSEVDDQVAGSNLTEIRGPLYSSEEAGGITEVEKKQIQEGFSFLDKIPSNDHQEHENLANTGYPGVATTTNSTWQDMLMGTGNGEADIFAFLEKECTSSLTSTLCDTSSRTVVEELHTKEGQSTESRHMEHQTPILTENFEKKMNSPIESEHSDNQYFMNCKPGGVQEIFQQESIFSTDPVKPAEAQGQNPTDNKKHSENIRLEPTDTKTAHASDVQSSKTGTNSTTRKQKVEKEKEKEKETEKSFDWDSLRKEVQSKGCTRRRSSDIMDSLDYEALRNADVREISDSIKERGMNNMLAARIKDFLNRLVKDHGSIDLEWLRDAQPDKVKDYLLSIRGLGLKSVECIRLLTLHHLAFPVDTNVGRIAVRLGWVPLQPLPESLQLHLLELYPMLETIQKYLWPRLCMLDQETLYELHYQLITFGKVFCTKRQPNCNACPMRGECRHFASAYASARFALPGPEERSVVCSDVSTNCSKSCGVETQPMSLPPPEDNIGSGPGLRTNCEPIIEEPATPESSIEDTERDIEDAFYEDPDDEIPEIKLNIEEFTSNLNSFIQENKEMQEGDMSKAIIALSPHIGSIPTPKLKHVSRLRTEHQVYELPDSHPLLEGMDRREPDDPSPYLLALWTPGETADSIQLPEGKCSNTESGMCDNKTCFTCNSARETHTQTVRGTILIPCRTAMRGSFPLNGTYFQVNEVFADDKTSRDPIHVPRSLIWNLPRRTVFFGTSVSTIFKGMSTEGIQYCFWRGFICVRGFDQKTRAPRPLKARLHLPASKIPKKND